MILEKILESPLDCKEIQPVNPEGNQSWTLIGRTDTEVEAPILWPPDVKNWLTGKDPDAGKDWRQEEKGMTADEMVGWHYQLDGHEFEQALGVDDWQRSLAFCSPSGHKESDMTEWLNLTKRWINCQNFPPKSDWVLGPQATWPYCSVFSGDCTLKPVLRYTVGLWLFWASVTSVQSFLLSCLNLLQPLSLFGVLFPSLGNHVINFSHW